MRIQDIVKLGHREQLLELRYTVKIYTTEFLRLHERHPLPNHHSSYVSLSEAFWLWRMAADLKPDIMAESGTFHGYSAWWLRKGSPSSLFRTHDPARSPHDDVLPGLTGVWAHIAQDFAAYWSMDNWSEFDGFVFFDDHIDQGLRLKQAVERGFKHILFHDVYPDTSATKPESLWSKGIPYTARVLQFPVILEPLVFAEAARSEHSWLTYIQVQ